MSATPRQRSLAARVGAYTLHAKHDSREVTAPARAAFLSRFQREVDPDGLLDPEERERRAAALRSAHFARLALASSRARAHPEATGAALESEMTKTEGHVWSHGDRCDV